MSKRDRFETDYISSVYKEQRTSWNSRGQRRGFGRMGHADPEPSAVEPELKQAIMFSLSLKSFTTLPVLLERVKERGVATSEAGLRVALDKMAGYGALVPENDAWKRAR